MNETFLLLYRSIHDVMRAESVLKTSRTPYRLVPVPTSVRSDCGMAVAVARDQILIAAEVLTSVGALPEEVYRRRPSGALRRIDPDQLNAR